MRDKRNIWSLLAVISLLASAVVLAFSPTLARYRAELTGDVQFQAKPLEKLDFSAYQWTKEKDAVKLTFSFSKDEEKCRIYFAISEGAVDPEALNVYLTLPGEEGIVEWEALRREISEVPGLAKQFGNGHVYCVYIQSEEDIEERIFSVKGGESYTLTVTGVDSAVVEPTLMRLFAERVE